MDKKILAIIPARGGSKGVLKKNARLLDGKPLIAWTIDSVKKTKYIDRIVVTTDDIDIETISFQYGAEVIKRPEEYASDISPVIDSVKHVLDVLKKSNYIPDIVLLLQCTTPFTGSKNIEGAVELFIKNIDRVDSVVSIQKEDYPPYWLQEISEEGKLKDFIPYDKMKYQRRQDFKELFKLNGAIYISSTENLIKNNRFLTNNTLPYCMDQKNSVDIDTEEDFKYAQYLSQYFREEK